MKRIFCLLTILFCTLFAFNASAQEERDSPRRGEGISVFLERNKRPGRAYYKEFLELNKKLLKGKEELRLGVKYVLPPLSKPVGNGKKTINEPLFGKALASVKVTSNQIGRASCRESDIQPFAGRLFLCSERAWRPRPRSYRQNRQNRTA